jgi:meso-butanediol dehydrogenase/(S,S)-butanediol dehydrogenase/diacetyl reductase
MASRLTGKVAVVTGGGGGIGSAIVELFCREGASVLAVDKNSALVASIAANLRSAIPGAQVESFTADISDYDQVASSIAAVVNRFGSVDVVVNNAAIRNVATIENTDRKDWDALIAVNLLGAVNVCKAALPEMRKSKKGSVVNVSSVFGVMGRENWGIYDATKAALISLTRTLACEEAKHGIRANSVSVASTLTPYTITRAQQVREISEQDLRNEVRKDNLLGRWAQPMEMAYPVLWLASEEASYITGTNILVDGGRSV